MNIIDTSECLIVDVTNLLPSIKESSITDTNKLYKIIDKGIAVLQQTDMYAEWLLLGMTKPILLQVMFTECTEGLLGVWCLTAFNAIVNNKVIYERDIIRLVTVYKYTHALGNSNYYILSDSTDYNQGIIPVDSNNFRGIDDSLSHCKLDLSWVYSSNSDSVYELLNLKLNIKSVLLQLFDFYELYQTSFVLQKMGTDLHAIINLSLNLIKRILYRMEEKGTAWLCMQDDIRFILGNFAELKRLGGPLH